MSETIFALATPPGRGAVAVVRLSGPDAGAALARLAGTTPAPRRAAVRRLRDPGDGRLLDEALVLWMPGPASFTGEDCAELHLHGGRAVVEGVLAALAEGGLRLAEPGEFSRRAFHNGKLDLAQAEAIADLVDAETERQKDQALAQLGGALGRRHEAWRGRLIEALARLEAAVDFPDEDLPAEVETQAAPAVEALERELSAALDEGGRGERVREGVRVALVGAPNAGKSSLLNALTGREAAIVADAPGTTRDVIEVPAVIDGYRVLLADMAGMRPTDDPIEAEGVRRARAWAEAAELRLLVVDGTAADPAPEGASLVRPGDLTVFSKSDLFHVEQAPKTDGVEAVRASVRTERGLADLRDRLAERVRALAGGRDFPAATRIRHRRHLAEALDHVRRCRAVLWAGGEVELAAEDLRLAARALARITGRIDAEEVLGEVFSAFCIGK